MVQVCLSMRVLAVDNEGIDIQESLLYIDFWLGPNQVLGVFQGGT